MASKNIAIKEKLYERLVIKKKQNESFSDVIERLMAIEESQKNISRSFGVWDDISDEIIEEMAQSNQRMRKQFEERFI